MVLCDILPWEAGDAKAGLASSATLFIATWLGMTLAGLITVITMSATVFYAYYWEPTYEQWTRKSNPEYPSAVKVREEILTMCRGMATATFCPALSIVLAHNGMSKAYCGFPEQHNGVLEQVFVFLGVWAFSDFFEWAYHYIGHTTQTFWVHHKAHHRFYNPTPFSVIADEYVDQFVRASPLLFMPLVFPLNIDVLFVEYAIFFYCYGTYLHWGHEVPEGTPFMDPHGTILNLATQHYLHHAKSINNKPYHTGFMFKIWDKIAGAEWKGECTCPKCLRKGDLRKPGDFRKVIANHDYKPLLDLNFWISGQVSAKPAEARTEL
eukprot:Clim_evm26s207 gene=Clim_evmTU26s207